MNLSKQLIKRYKKNNIFFIVELGSKIVQSPEKIFNSINFFKKIGVAAIKIQHLFANEILHPQVKRITINEKRVNLYQNFKKSETNLKRLQEIKNKCQRKDILFLSSFFGDKSFANLNSLNIDAYKIASPESKYLKIWKLLQSINKPIFFSTGITFKKDLDFIFNYLQKNKVDKNKLIMLHCVTAYPCQPEDYNLLLLNNLRKEYKVLVGLSDHSNNPYLVPFLSVILMAIFDQPLIIEKHFSLTKQGDIDESVSVDQEEMEKLMTGLVAHYQWGQKNKSTLSSEYKSFSFKKKSFFLELLAEHLEINKKKIKKILGNGKKKLANGEKKNYHTSNRSLIAIKNIIQGARISKANSAFLRAEQKKLVGLNFKWEEKIHFLKATKNIKNGQPISLTNSNLFR